MYLIQVGISCFSQCIPSIAESPHSFQLAPRYKMGINHDRLDCLMPHQFLHSPNAHTCHNETSDEGVSSDVSVEFGCNPSPWNDVPRKLYILQTVPEPPCRL